jgi:hypothetical protein
MPLMSNVAVERAPFKSMVHYEVPKKLHVINSHGKRALVELTLS